jgi:hypothetical protein
LVYLGYKRIVPPIHAARAGNVHPDADAMRLIRREGEYRMSGKRLTTCGRPLAITNGTAGQPV